MKQTLVFFQQAFEAAPNGMMLVDDTGHVVLVNAQLEKLFGYSSAELIGRSVDSLLPERYRGGHDAKRRSFFADPHARPMGAGRELFALRKDGREVPVEIGLSPITTPTGTLVVSSIVDISERREAQRLLQASLHEKETLLKELHHRAKNNLQLIASLLDLASAVPGRDVLRECRDRIHSISLVHEKLYQSGTFARIEMKDYLSALGEQVVQTWGGGDPRITFALDAEDLWLPLDTAIPLGLIVNELLSNSFKHAFPELRPGRVLLKARRVDDTVEFHVEDDGIGMPNGLVRREGHIGLELVHALSKQLRAALRFETTQGTRVHLTFKSLAP